MSCWIWSAAALPASQVSHSPKDFAAIYDAGSTPTASNTTVGIITWGDMTQTITDLNSFTSGAGMATLQSRIAGAVKAVCGRPDSRDLHALGDWQKCRTQAMEGAVQQLANARVNMPTLALAAS